MKLVKLSLVAALAVGSFSTLSAKPLEEAIKNVNIFGQAWYRYDSGGYISTNGYNLDTQNSIPYKQTHRVRLGLNISADLGDGFKMFGMLAYNNENYGYPQGRKADGTYQYPQGAQPGYGGNASPVMRQAYLQYNNNDMGLTFNLGRQFLKTIWENAMIGTGAKLTLTPTNGLTIAAFAVDSFQILPDVETTFKSYDAAKGQSLDTRLFKENLYGAAVLGNFGPVKAELWGANWDKTATLYAVKLDYALRFGNRDSFRIHANYLGNVIDGILQNDVRGILTNQNEDVLAGGNLYNLKAELKVAGLDAHIGGMMFGKKNRYTLNTLEEQYGGDIDMAVGSEILTQRGSWMQLSAGQSTYGYFGVGYTLPANVRFGVKGVYGETKEAGINDKSELANGENGGGKKMEGVAELSYALNSNLDFLTYYSYLHTNAKNGFQDTITKDISDAKSIKNTVRFQARYKY